ncbi:MAG TPA: histidine phosphatase family protein [Myxococcota bacterium]|nr:histidine phosphatase family protein [Myxococcota bacterium]
MIEIVLVRHAQPDWEPGGRAVDFPELSAHGRLQAQAVAEALANESFDHCYTSTLERAIETSEFIARRLAVRFEQCSWLDELRLPPLEGQTVEQVEKFFKDVRARDLARWWDGMPGGEAFRHMYERVVTGVESLLEGTHGMRRHDNSGYRLWHPPEADQRILIVAHEGTNAVILSRLLDVEPVPWAPVRFAAFWASISRLSTMAVADGFAFALRGFNLHEHLLPLGLPPGGRRG